jgi:hypothetical protein
MLRINLVGNKSNSDRAKVGPGPRTEPTRSTKLRRASCSLEGMRESLSESATKTHSTKVHLL